MRQQICSRVRAYAPCINFSKGCRQPEGVVLVIPDIPPFFDPYDVVKILCSYCFVVSQKVFTYLHISICSPVQQFLAEIRFFCSLYSKQLYTLTRREQAEKTKREGRGEPSVASLQLVNSSAHDDSRKIFFCVCCNVTFSVVQLCMCMVFFSSAVLVYCYPSCLFL